MIFVILTFKCIFKYVFKFRAITFNFSILAQSHPPTFNVIIIINIK